MTETPDNRLPVTLVAGLPGSGKSTVLQQAMPQLGQNKTAVFSHNSGLRESGEAKLFPFSDSLIEWEGKGGRTLLSQDLLIDIGRLARDGGFDAAVVEWHGTLDLLQAVDSFSVDLDGKEHRLKDLARIDTIVSVLNASTFNKNFQESAELRGLGLARGRQDERTLTDLLVDQVEWSDVLVLNKIDRARVDDVRVLEGLSRELNPNAEILKAERGKTPQTWHSTGHCNMDHLGRFRYWLPSKRREGLISGSPIQAVYFAAERPFHPARLHDAMDPYWDNTLRSKGLLWLASRPSLAGIWSQAGDLIDLDWTNWEKPYSGLDSLAASSQDTRPKGIGKPRQQMLLAGLNLPVETVRNRLEGALLTEEEMKMPRSTWEHFPDPFSFDAQVNE